MKKRGPTGSALFTDLEEAVADAAGSAARRGYALCVISRFSPKRGRTVYRVVPLAGFGLPQGWTFEETVEPGRERIEVEPQEKSSTNGF
jgi:hypothetical protein